MEDINYNDNNRIIIKKESFEQIISDINNKDKKYTFVDFNDYILFLKIITNETDNKLFKKVKDIKKEYKNYDLRFDIDNYYNDLESININKYKAIKYYSDLENKIIYYCNENKDEINKLNINLLICKLKYKLFENVEFKNNIEYDMINKILEKIKICNISIDNNQYDKKYCINNFNKNYKKIISSFDINKSSNLKKASLILGGSVGLIGLTILSIPAIFGISVLGPISGGLFAYLQSIGVTLSVIQSISMTGITVTIGSCCISGATLIILPGLAITYKDITENKKLHNEIEKYINYKINEQ